MAGRPTDYKEDMPQRVLDWLETKTDSETVKKEGPAFTEYKIKVSLPTIQGLARHLNCNKTTLYEWAKLYPEFSNALDKVLTEQHDRLMDNGLSGDYNSTIAKLVLSSNHGYVERRDITSEGKSMAPSAEQKKEADSAVDKFLDKT